MLIYLDIDGVLIPTGEPRDIVPGEQAHLLRSLVSATGAKIVISSARRRSLPGILRLIGQAGLHQSALYSDGAGWRTPLDMEFTDEELSLRGQEIALHRLRSPKIPYVILDDVPVLAHQASYHVQPDERIGLTDSDVARAIEILLAQTRSIDARCTVR